MSEPVKVVLASHNAHKLVELRRVLGAQLDGIELVSYGGPEPRETGLSFEANALLKARAAAEHTGLPALADDSGISVDVLGGSPGIFSARWSGPAKDATENLELLLWQLSDVAHPHRAAQFVAAAALVVPASASPTGEELSEAVLGVWPGRILEQRSGDHGFGYDPIFQPEGARGSVADLTDAEKDASSHRSRAFRNLLPALSRILA